MNKWMDEGVSGRMNDCPEHDAIHFEEEGRGGTHSHEKGNSALRRGGSVHEGEWAPQWSSSSWESGAEGEGKGERM